MKLYNTTFKRPPQTVSQATGLYFEQGFLSAPRTAKLLSLQILDISEYERLNRQKGRK